MAEKNEDAKENADPPEDAQAEQDSNTGPEKFEDPFAGFERAAEPHKKT